LTYLLTAKTPIGQQARWLDFMSEFNFEIIHRAGISHINADSLSRKSPCDAGGIYCKQCHRGEKEAEEDVEGNTVGLCAVVTTRAQKREAEAPQEPDVVVTDSPVQPVQQETTTSDPDTRPPPRKRGRPRKTAAPAIDQTVGEEPENPEMTTERTEPGPAASQGEPRSPTKGGRRRKVLDNRIRRAMEPWTDSFLREKQVEDRNIKTVLEWIEAGARPDFNTVRAFSPSVKGYWQQYSSLYTENGVLYRRVEPAVDGQQAARQLILPRALRQEFLDLVHGGIGGHLGSFKTRAHVGRRAYWYMWRRDVDMYCKRCVTCNEYHRGKNQPKRGLLKPMVIGAPFERWGIDLAGPFPKSAGGHAYILTAICVFSKFVILRPLRDKTAQTVAKVIYEQVFMRFGGGEILTDNGLEFRNELLSELCKLTGVARAFTTAYEARTNAVCERNHATINSMLAKCVKDNHRDWHERLVYVAFCYNASVHESTGFTPFFLLHGTEPRWDVDIKVGSETKVPYSSNEYADSLINKLENAHDLCRDHLQVTASRMSDWYDKKVKVQSFEEGDQVYVLNLRAFQGRCPKWIRRYRDVAQVVQKINDVTYRVKCDQWKQQKTRIVHVDKLKRKELVQLPDMEEQQANLEEQQINMAEQNTDMGEQRTDM